MGFPFCALRVTTAWQQIYLGIRFPPNMLGSLMVAVFSVMHIGTMRRHIDKLVLPLVVLLFEFFVNLLHSPAAVFPRHSPFPPS